MRLHHPLGAVTAAAAAIATAATVLVGAPAFAEDDGPVQAGIAVAKINDLPADFINGVDVSSILSEEESGVVFRDFAGQPADPFEVLAQAGINYVRVRVWNDPFNSTTHEGYGAGNTNAERATEIAERATEAGMRVLVDFHYSDFWADPGKQKAPKAWAGMTVAQKATAAHDFTEATLQGMEDAGVDVGMVQIGNETNGMVAGVSGIPTMAQIFSAGSAAVRSVYPDALVALHFTNPETAGRYADYAAQLDAAGVDYDVFASSYYPYWHGTLANLTSVLSQVATTYGKKVMVAETSWAYTLADGDGTANSVSSVGSPAAYPVSVQGQATEIRDVMAAVNDVPGGAGLGVFYWEPAWIPVPGATLAERRALWAEYGSGWATTAAAEYDSGAPTVNAEGSGWDNQALFDYNGNPLESLRAFAYARTGAVAPLEVTGVENPSVTFTQGDTLALPSTVTVTFNDSSTAQEAVTWDNVLGWITSPGTYAVHGVTSGGHATTATVVVNAVNYLVDGDFEQGNFAGWSQDGTTTWPSTYWVQAPGGNAYGDWAVNVYNATAFAFTFHQQVTGLEPGTYVFRGLAQGADVTTQAYATTSEGTVNASVALSGYLAWKRPSVTVTVPADGTVTVGINGTGLAGGWGWLDNFELVKAPSGADTAGLHDLVDQMDGLTRSVYSDDSLAALDAAVRVARIVLAASEPTAQQVADAMAGITSAFDALVVVGDVPDPTVGAVVISAVEGDAIALPAEVTVTGFDGRHHQEAVTWDAVTSWIDGPGTYTVHGTTESGLAALATITVSQRTLVNGDFESGDLTGWSTTASTWPSTFWYSNDASSVHGTTAVNIYGSNAYDFDLSQSITGLPAGSYTLSAQAHGGSDAGTPAFAMDLTAVTSLGATSTPVTVSGWGNWATFSVAFTVPADGALTVSLGGTGGATDWAFFDDFTLVREAAAVDTSALEAAVAAANGIDRSLYEAPSLVAVDHAIAVAAIVLAATSPSQATVDNAAALIAAAIAGLDPVDVPFTTAPVPTITGTASVGHVLTASAGTWVPTPSGIAYQWLRNGEAISGATGATYTVTAADVLAALKVTVTATKADVITQSQTSTAVTVPLQQFAKTPVPTITGGTTAGSTLTAKPGTWSPAATAYMYQWQRNGTNIAGANAATYKLTTADRAKTITVEVTGLRTGFASVTKESAGTYIPGVFAAPTPKITGTPIPGKKLTVTVGTWSPKATKYTYQWYRDGKAIKGQKGKTYTVRGSDVKHTISVKVTGSKAGYTTKTVSSAKVTVVKRFARTGYASITGTSKVGHVLTGHRGLWSPAPSSFAFQWYRNGVAIKGATHVTYKLTSADRGKKVTLKVTVKRAGYLTTSHTSPARVVK